MNRPGLDKRARAAPDLPGLGESSWEPTVLECSVDGTPQPLQQCLLSAFKAIQSHELAWPFQTPVPVAEAPDYYDVVKDPIDLSLISRRLQDPSSRYYVSAAMFLADICRMCENCRLYNSEETIFWDCANRLEAFARKTVGEVREVRRKLR
jgi:histone acetyltransferase